MTAGINRRPPPRVRQTRIDSCWAATLESWSRIDSRLPSTSEAEMIETYGEGPTGGITPITKIPQIADRFGLYYGGFNGDSLRQ